MKLFKLILFAWWRLDMWRSRVWHNFSLMRLAGLTDSEFLESMDQWRAHPNYLVRVVCSRRWIKATWPNDDIARHEEDGRLVWERRKQA